MRLVIQRVKKANVVDTQTKKKVGEVKEGLLVLLGVKEGDSKKDADKLAEKLKKLRIMADDKGKMNLSVVDTTTSILAISQFTLYADTKKGNRPSFIKAADPKLAQGLYNYFLEKLREYDINVETGSFGAYMHIEAQLDGPVTIIIDSDDK